MKIQLLPEAHVTYAFIQRLATDCLIDTRRYRYYIRIRTYGFDVERLPIKWLGTTRALGGWQLVARVFPT